MKTERIIIRVSKKFKRRIQDAAKRRRTSVAKFIRKTMVARMDWFRPK